MTTREENLIDLNYEIAVKLFDKHAFEPHPVNNSICEVCNLECQNHIHKWPHYTTDPAASLEVLKRCAEKLDKEAAILGIDKDGAEFRVIKMKYDYEGYEVADVQCAPTLELAICQFARNLYHIHP
jgi:hypothetical protein